MFELTVLQNLVYSEEYSRKSLPFLKAEYFHDQSQKTVFELIQKYVQQYNGVPTKETLVIELQNLSGINELTYKTSKDLIESLKHEEGTQLDWLVQNTEKFCQDKAVYNAIMQSIQIIDDKGGKYDKGSIPKILQDALSVSFNQSVGHDYFTDSDARYEFYHRQETRIPFDLDYFNTITKGGLPNKTLNVCMAGTGVGKSLFMCHCAAANLTLGKNVLYITLEMAEERIAERIDANLLNVTVDELSILPKDVYDKKVDRVKRNTVGKLIIKEYPTASANVQHFRHLLNELKLKKNFVPDIIYIDYLNICASSRIKPGSNVNTYSYIKSIAEEIRGLAVEFDLPIVSATQTNRGGSTSTDVDMTDTSDSFGLPMTVDFMFALISTEELQELNQIMVKQLKNRYNDPVFNRRFVIGVDRPKMRLFNTEQSAQEDILDGPVFDSTGSGERIGDEQKGKFKKKFNQLII